MSDKGGSNPEIIEEDPQEQIERLELALAGLSIVTQDKFKDLSTLPPDVLQRWQQIKREQSLLNLRENRMGFMEVRDKLKDLLAREQQLAIELGFLQSEIETEKMIILAKFLMDDTNKKHTIN